MPALRQGIWHGVSGCQPIINNHAGLHDGRYELESHYEWHDDMEYRQMVDRLPNEPPVANTQTTEGNIVSSDILAFGSGIYFIPVPWVVGKRGGYPPGIGILAL